MEQSRDDRYSLSINKGLFKSNMDFAQQRALYISMTREITEERNIGPTYPSTVVPDPAKKILPEKVHGPL